MTEKIVRFEDLVAWQKTHTPTSIEYNLTRQGDFAKDFGLRDQTRRAAVSVMSNTAEGFERGKSSEFHQFLSLAKASFAELRSQLSVAFDIGCLTKEESQNSHAHASEVARIRGGLRVSMERRRFP